MTTAHRPTFDPARGKEALRGPAYHQRLLPAHTHLKTRQSGQGNEAESAHRDLRAELLQAEANHFAKKNGVPVPETPTESSTPKRQLEGPNGADGDLEDEDPEAKRRRILEETRDIDADSDGSEEDKERERAAEEEEQREVDIARGNPLLNPTDFNMKRRWDDDVVFKNQARGTEDKRGKEFVNDLLRSDFHKKFMSKYMDSQPTSKALHSRINNDISQLLQRFENIMATATVESTSHTTTAVETYQLDVESTALIRAAEDILSLTRSMKETWLFGKLDTLGEDESETKRREELERDAAVIQKAIEDQGVLKRVKE
ncbi:uncharacterized protein BDV17DRAFT_284264 [Aspergillus undulatus]|uniref:uncharacterized protein n=1 Tax=Aspergillus undulatus TaxID=1810928 RepID=UPI003CCDE958